MSDFVILLTMVSALTGMGMTWYVVLFLKNQRDSKPEFKIDEGVEYNSKRSQLEQDVYRAEKKLSSSYVGFSTIKNVYSKRLGDVNLSTHAFDDSFFVNMGFNLEQIVVEEKFIACLMPFHPNYNKVYNSIIRATNNTKFKCHRADEKYTAGEILRHSVELILKSQIVIAVLDGRNSNVFYELGIAHSVGKPVILITEEKSEIPFDLNSKRFIFYKSPNDLERKLSAALKAIT